MNVGARRNRKNKKDRNTMQTSNDNTRLYRTIIVGAIVVIPIAIFIYFLYI